MKIETYFLKGSLLLSLLFFFAQLSAQADCATAVDIGNVGNTTYCFTPGQYNINADMSSSTASAVTVASCDDVAGVDNDLWYEFTTLTTGEIQIVLEYAGASPANVVIHSGTCASLTEEFCWNVSTDGVLFGEAVTLSPSTSYYLQVVNDASDSPLGTMNFCIQESVCSVAAATGGLAQPGADECLSAVELNLAQPFIGFAGCSDNFTLYSPGGFANPASGSGCAGFYIIEGTSWYGFEAGATSVELDYNLGNCEGTNGGGTGLEILIYDNNGTTNCGTIAPATGTVQCAVINSTMSTGTITIAGLTSGNDYLVMVDPINDLPCFYSFTPSTGFVTLPPNDECDNATALPCGGSVTGDAAEATNTDAPSACGGITPTEGVWFTITGDGSDITISTDNAGTAGTFDTQIAIYSGTCASLTCVGGDNDSGTGNTSSYTFTSVNGTDYYVYLTGSGLDTYELSATCVTCNADAGNW